MRARLQRIGYVAAFGHLAVSWSDSTVPRIFSHAHQFQAEVAKSVKDAVKVGLIMDLADEDALLASRFYGKPLECGDRLNGVRRSRARRARAERLF